MFKAITLCKLEKENNKKRKIHWPLWGHMMRSPVKWIGLMDRWLTGNGSVIDDRSQFFLHGSVQVLNGLVILSDICYCLFSSLSLTFEKFVVWTPNGITLVKSIYGKYCTLNNGYLISKMLCSYTKIWSTELIK